MPWLHGDCSPLGCLVFVSIVNVTEFSPNREDFITKTHEELLSLACWPAQPVYLEFLIFLSLPESRYAILSGFRVGGYSTGQACASRSTEAVMKGSLYVRRIWGRSPQTLSRRGADHGGEHD